MLFGDLVDGGRVTVDVVNDKLEFTVTAIPKPLTKEERKAIRAAKTAATLEAKEDDITENQDNNS